MIDETEGPHANKDNENAATTNGTGGETSTGRQQGCHSSATFGAVAFPSKDTRFARRVRRMSGEGRTASNAVPARGNAFQ